MAVGKGSMERAAKAAEQKAEAGEKETVKANPTKASSAKKASSVKKATASTIAAPKKEVLERIVYQKSNGVLARDAQHNEIFGLGDEMPVYFL